MRYVDLTELRCMGCDVRDAEIFPESWTKRHAFSLYESTPRPCSALFLVCTDIRVTFFSKNGNAVTALCGDVVWIPAGSCYHVRVEGGSVMHIDTYTLNFCLLDEDGEEISFSDSIKVLAHRLDGVLEPRARALSEAIHRVDGEVMGGKRNRLKIKAEFFAFLDVLAASPLTHADCYYPIRLGAEALRNEWNLNERIEKYADMCGISSAYFYQCFRAWSGQSPVEYRNGIRLSQAQSMLRNTDMRIGEIAEIIGFEDPFYFCRVFSKCFGMSPKEWRKKRRTEDGNG